MVAPSKGGGSAVKKPGKLDFKRAEKVVKKVIDENTEWLKEMAKK